MMGVCARARACAFVQCVLARMERVNGGGGGAHWTMYRSSASREAVSAAPAPAATAPVGT